MPYETLVIFGATGDLAQRMLFPALFDLHVDELLPQALRIVGAARSPLDDTGFRALVAATLPGDERVASFLERLRYRAVEADRPEGFDALARLIGDTGGGVAFYLSTPPSLFAPVVAGLARAGLAGPHARVALEKPIGFDLASSRAVNDAVAQAFAESQVFRVDHYLGKETVQNLLVLRFANVMFEPLWNSAHIEHIQITVTETVGLEGRVSYYDGVGALSDMVQNHMLQLLALVAMEPPASYTAAAVRDEKVKVLRSLRPLDADTAATHSVRGQYRAGAIDGAPVPGYLDELGQPSERETFVAVKAHVDNWRWHGVPFYLRTGKRMAARHSEIVVRFRAVPHSIFGVRGRRLSGRGLVANALVIRLQPDEGISLSVMTKEPGLDREGVALGQVDLDVSLTREFQGARRHGAYERLLLDLLDGDTTLFVRGDEIEAAWTWIDSIHAAWAEADVATKPYTAGSWGPAAAEGLVERDGVSWHDGE